MTERLPSLEDITTTRGCDFIEIESEEGFVIAMNLHKSNKVAVARTKFSSGSRMGFHTHNDAVEWIIVVKGALKISYQDREDKYLKAKEYVTLIPGIPHSVMALDDTEAIVITIPPDKGFPGHDG